MKVGVTGNALAVNVILVPPYRRMCSGEEVSGVHLRFGFRLTTTDASERFTYTVPLTDEGGKDFI